MFYAEWAAMMPRDSRTVVEVRALLSRSRGDALRRLVRELEDDERTGVRSAVSSALAAERARTREQARLQRLYALEARLRLDGWQVVAGVDEVGRGALAGPLTAGACVLPLHPRLTGLDDSKRLTRARREELAVRIREVALCWSVAHVPAADLDRLGMTAALRRAMSEALGGLNTLSDHVIVDGRPMGIASAETAVVGGDGKVAAVAAASILAKVERDALMVALSPSYPDYGFEINKGYGTSEHLAAIETLGPCPEHRRSFTPCGGTARLF